MNYFSKNLRFLRKEAGLNQEEIALLFQKKANTIGNWENRKSEPSLEELIRLAEYFRVPTEALIHTRLEETPTPGYGLGSRLIPSAADVSKPGETLSLPAGLPNDHLAVLELILRELRSLHETLDILQINMRAPSHHLSADKSSH
jgi:transcriptional regulator with XRE-family HTH domain